jgi:hypothetical protein
MTPDRKHPAVAFWITVTLLVVQVGYPLSFGPACWWWPHEIGAPDAPYIYWPFGWLITYGPRPISRAIAWYATLGTGIVWVPVNAEGQYVAFSRE